MTLPMERHTQEDAEARHAEIQREEQMSKSDDLKQLAASLGYGWPDDEIGQKRVLILMAHRAAYWRKECDEYHSGVYREKTVQHLQRRCLALAKRLRNVRAAAIAYKQGRDFDLMCKEKPSVRESA